MRKLVKKILITGNLGYIGSHLCEHLSPYSYLLFGLDKANPVSNPKVDKFYKEDIRNLSISPGQEFDCIIHLASEVNAEKSIRNPILYYDTNINGTLNLLKTFKTKSFIFASTNSAEAMNTPYSRSKRFAEDIVFQYCTTYKIPYTIFRFCNVLGSKDTLPTDKNSLIYNLINAQNTGQFNLFGDDYNTIDGSAVRDYTHITEVCHAITLAIEEPTYSVETLGHGVETTVKQMIELYKKINNCDFKVNVCSRREYDLERNISNSPSKFMKKLYTLEDLLRYDIK